MSSPPTDSIDDFIRELRAIESAESPILTATIDLRGGSDGRPVALRMLRQAVREATDRYAAEVPDRKPPVFDEDVETLEAVIDEATSRGAAGLLYVGAADIGLLKTLETAYPLRNAIDIDSAPCLFEVVRYRYLAGAGAVLASISLREVDITKVRYGIAEATDSVEPPRRIEKLKQRTKPEGFGGPRGMGGHALNRVHQRIEAVRVQYASEAADRIASLVEAGDVLVLAGTDSGRSAIRRQLPDNLNAQVLESPALDPTEDGRARIARLTDLVTEKQYAASDDMTNRWFQGEWGGLAEGGIASASLFAEQGRLGTLILHDDVVDHFGDASDARDRVPQHPPHAIEELVRNALAVSADIIVTREPRALAEHQGVLAIARY